jgi:nucleotide-binding universal stress UspA family protein
MLTEDQMKMAAPRLVVVGVDGSPNSLAALRRAGHEARERGAGLLLVHVVPAHAHHSAVTRGYRMLEMAVRYEFPDGLAVPLASVVDCGDPAHRLVKRCAHAELLVVGGRIHSEHGNLLGGDVVPYCMRQAPCPLVVCADHRVPSARPVNGRRSNFPGRKDALRQRLARA